MRRSMRRTHRGNGRVFTITWIVLALVLGMLGLRYRQSTARARAAKAAAPAQQVRPDASPELRVQPKPANERNG